MTGGKGNPRGFARDFGHAWLRLIDVDGSVCSVGFFPDESGGISPDRRPGLRMPGMLLHPDKYDGLRYPRRTTQILLSPERFDAVRAHLVDLQAGRPRGTLAFGLVDRSCVSFLTEVAAVAGVEIDGTYGLLRAACDQLPDRVRDLVVPRLRASTARRGGSGASRPFGRRLWRFACGTVFNTGLAMLGGRRVESIEWVTRPDRSVAARRVDGLQPLFGRWRDVLGPAVPFFHVRALIDWQERVGPQLVADAEPPQGPQ